MRTSLATGLLCVLLTLVTAGCGSETGPAAARPTDGRELPPGSWTLVAARDAAGELPLSPQHPVTLDIDAEGVSGRLCNAHAAQTPATDTGPLVGPLTTTDMGCLPVSVMELETRYLAALGAVTTARATTDGLVLSGGDIELRYAATTGPAPVELTGQPWLIDTLISGGGPDSSVASTRGGTTVRFLDGGAVEFDTSCARYTGTWGADGELLVEYAGTYDATCRGDRDRESRALEALLEGGTWELTGERLALVGRDGAGVGLRAGR